MYLDHQLIFRGELARATGGVDGAEGSEVSEQLFYLITSAVSISLPIFYPQTILFTMDAAVLSLVADHDPLYQSEVAAEALKCGGDYHEDRRNDSDNHRPQTADRDDRASEDKTYNDQRPFTTARIEVECDRASQDNPSLTAVSERGDREPCSSEQVDSSVDHPLVESSRGRSGRPLSGHVLQVSLIESWGDSSYIGLTGLELLKSPTQEPLHLREDQLTGHVGEGLGMLVGGVNLTTEAETMFLCPLYHSSDPPTITITLDVPTPLFGMKIWNYNSSLEDSYKGVS